MVDFLPSTWIRRYFGLIVIGALMACSEAVTPIPFLDGGTGGSDAGTPRGGRDQACIEGDCNENALLCTGDGNNPPAFFCRLSCDLTSAVDQCGERFRCAARGDGQGVCQPALLLNETCAAGGQICDDELVCAVTDPDDAGLGDGTCRFACEVPMAAADAGPDAGALPPDPCPAGEGACRALANVPGQGACLN